jgi:hypothetical protein
MSSLVFLTIWKQNNCQNEVSLDCFYYEEEKIFKRPGIGMFGTRKIGPFE